MDCTCTGHRQHLWRTLYIFGVKLYKRKTQSSLHSHKKSGRWFVVSQRLFKAWQEEYLAVCISMYAFSITRKYLFRPSNKVSLSLCNEQGDQQTDTTKAIILLLCGQYRIALIDSLQSQVAFCNMVTIILMIHIPGYSWKSQNSNTKLFGSSDEIVHIHYS